MVVPNSESNLQFGQFAVRYGDVSEEQLQLAIAAWNGDEQRTLADMLVEQGALTEKQRKSLETLMAAYLICESEPAHDEAESTPSHSSQADTVIQGSILGATTEDNPLTPLVIDDEQRFKRTELHAEGGLGKVYEAHDRQLNRTVALKEIKGRYADDNESRERFTKEAEITGRLEHPGIVPVYALGRYADGRPYYAMRFIKGNSLRSAIGKYYADDTLDRAGRVLGMRALLGRLIDVCHAISYAHRRGIVHRDIKPSNIMLGEYGETLVVDWGLAKNLGKREQQTSASLAAREDTLLPVSGSSVTKTMVGKAVGSPAFMSPEQARGEHEDVEFASDIYGLGATLYMILTGQPPVQGKNSAEVLSKVRKGELQSPRMIDRSISRPLDAICMKALAYEVVDRYNTVRDLRRDLDRYLADEKVQAHQETLIEAGLRLLRRRRWLLPTLLVGMLGIFGIAGVFGWSERMRQAEAAENAEAVGAAFDTVSRAFRVIDPFADNDTNIQELERECRKVNQRDIPELAKAKVYDALVYQFIKFKRPGIATTWAIESLDISRAKLGPTAPETRERERVVAQTFSIDGRFAEGAAWLQKLVEESPEKDDNYYASVHDLSTFYIRLNQFEKAIPLLREVIEYREAKLGSNDKRTIGSKSTLGTVLSKAGYHDEARQLLEAAAAAAADSPTFTTEQRLAMISNAIMPLTRDGSYDEALKRLNALLPRYQESLGEDHAKTLSLRYTIASTHRDLGNFAEALKRIDSVMAEYKRTFGEDHSLVKACQLVRAQTHLASGEFEQAEMEAQALLDAYLKTNDRADLQRMHLAAETLTFSLLATDQHDAARMAIETWDQLQPLNELGSREQAKQAFSQLIAQGEHAVGSKNFGTAAQVIGEAANVLQGFDSTLVDQAGLASLKGALNVGLNNQDAAREELEKANGWITTEGKRFRPYQWYWPKLIKSRLSSIAERQQASD